MQVFLTPYPGTKLYYEFLCNKRLITDNLSLYNTTHVVFQPKQVTPEELYNGYIWMYKELYSYKNIIRCMPKAKKQWMAYLTFNLLYRKHGRITDKICKLITYRRIGWWVEKLSRYI